MILFKIEIAVNYLLYSQQIIYYIIQMRAHTLCICLERIFYNMPFASKFYESTEHICTQLNGTQVLISHAV